VKICHKYAISSAGLLKFLYHV